MKLITNFFILMLSFCLLSCGDDNVEPTNDFFADTWLFLGADPADDLSYDSYFLNFKGQVLVVTSNDDPSYTEEFTYKIKDSELILTSPKYSKSYSFPIKQDGERLKIGNYFPILEMSIASVIRSPEWSVYMKNIKLDSFEGTNMISKWKDENEGSEMSIYKDKIVIKGMPIKQNPKLTGTYLYEVSSFDSEYLVFLRRSKDELPCAGLLFSEITDNSMKVVNMISSYGIEYHMTKE